MLEGKLALWLLRGGWKWLAGALVIIGLLIWGLSWLNYYHGLQETAAQYETLKAQKADADRRLSAAVNTIRANEIAAAQAAKDLRITEADRAAFFAELRKGMSRAAVATNPVCFPSDDERGVRNRAVERYAPGAGRSGSAGSVPAVP